MSKEDHPARRGNDAARVRAAVNSHVRLSGKIRVGPRYAMLEADDGHLWRLRAEDDLGDHADRRVTIEARVSAVDLLSVLWLGAEGTGEGERSSC